MLVIMIIKSTKFLLILNTFCKIYLQQNYTKYAYTFLCKYNIFKQR